MYRPGWWEHASGRDVAAAWDTATAWQQHDPQAQRAVSEIREQLRERYGLDEIPQDPSALAAQLTARETHSAAARRGPSTAETVEASAILSTPAERDVDVDVDAAPSADTDVAGVVAYDSRERREALAERLRDGGVEPDVIEARVLADVCQALPVAEAVARPPRGAPSARRARGSRGSGLDQPRSDRGR